MKCQYCYSGPAEDATKTWALIPLCEAHYHEIRSETMDYYKKRITYEDRKAYHRISHRIPWSRVNMEDDWK